MSATRSPTAAIYHKYAQRDIRYTHTHIHKTDICVLGYVCVCHINPTLVSPPTTFVRHRVRRSPFVYVAVSVRLIQH